MSSTKRCSRLARSTSKPRTRTPASTRADTIASGATAAAPSRAATSASPAASAPPDREPGASSCEPEPREHRPRRPGIGRAHEHPGLARVAELVERALRHQATHAHDADVRAHLLDLGEQVARDEHGRAVVGERPDERAHLAGALRVEAVRGLVEHEQLAAHEQRVREPEPLLHAERVRVHLLAGGVRESDPVERLGDARGSGAARRVPVGGVEAAQVRLARQVGRERRPLHERADAGQHRVHVPRHVGAEHARVARARRDEAEQHPDRGGLARAVRPEEPEHGARAAPRGRGRRRPSGIGSAW